MFRFRLHAHAGKNFLNLELADGNSNFNSALKESLLELDTLGMSHVLHTEQVEAISTLARSAKNGSAGLNNFYLMPKYMLLNPIRFFYGG